VRRIRAHPFRLLGLALLLALTAASIGWISVQCWAGHNFRAGRTDLDHFHNPQAIAHLKACLQIWPRDPDVLYLAARAARRAGAFEEAELALEKYQRLRGSDEALNLERILLRANRGDVDSVAGFCRSRIDQGDPAATLVLEAAAEGLLRAYRLPEAEARVRQWQQVEPDNVQALYLLGRIRELEQRDWLAIESYREVVQRDPDHDEGRLAYSGALLQTRAFAEATVQLEELHRRQPQNLLVLVRLAQCRHALADSAAAKRILDDVLVRQPHFSLALTEAGKLAVERGEWEYAETLLREAVARARADIDAHYQFAQCLRHSGRDSEAREEDQLREQLVSDRQRLFEIEAHEMGERPHDPALHCEMGQILIRAGFIAAGARWLESALRQDPHYTPAHKALAEHYAKTGDRARAAEHRRRATH
jgi:predicted Zn-dependent protease